MILADKITEERKKNGWSQGYADTIQGKSFSGVGNNFVRALATEIENKEEYEFLKGNKELEAIFSQYLKQIAIKIYRNDKIKAVKIYVEFYSFLCIIEVVETI